MRARIGFGLMGLLLYNAIVYYLGWNVYEWIYVAFSFHGPIAFSIIWAIIAYSIVIGRIHHKLRLFKIIGSYWMIVMQYGLLLFPIANLLVWLVPGVHTKWIGYVIVILMTFIVAIGSYMAYSPVVRNLTIKIQKTNPLQKPLRMVIGSDFHLGILSNKTHLNRFVKMSNEAKPDVIFLVGDLVDDDPVWYVEYGMSEVMKQLKSTYGIYGVLGNHEYYGRKIPLFVHEMAESGVRILQDETILVAESFYVTGREDKTNTNRKSLEKLAETVDHKLPWIVMDHTPSDIETPSKIGVDIHLSGHTHLGQMWPNQFITRKTFEHDYGYKLKVATHTIVSSGFGFWGPPIRTNSRSEMWVVDVLLTE
ncbi:metallophosphoesterase [Viridibacillus sp. YIM B01967]|uniref:Metallophosphoesterase n=1 Tax=Viridibacillus soli TaxID=2798301 RepID=A0ABS1H8U5_9BACL|nr:metallophosphoesterase [Viridibacillus soli]MBK3495522.1 metallophosphoesterase [Viridibacillus soli]